MRTQPVTQMSMLIAVATIVAALEGLIQLPVPYFRIGLSHVMTLFVIQKYGFKQGVILVVFRVILANLILGKLFQPVFWLSFSGGLAATLVMGMSWIALRKMFSTIGISILGALTHNIIQVLVASVLIVKQMLIVQLWPLIVSISIIAGLLIGILVNMLNLWSVKHPEIGQVMHS